MNEPENARRYPRWVAPAIVLGAVLLFVYENRHVSPQLDDAYIIYRYARNLVEGHGFVFNVGERVEGVTTLLWTLLVALGMKFGFEAPAVAHVLGVLSGVALLWLTYSYAKVGLGERERPIAALAPWFVLASTCFAIWTNSGLETPLFAVTVLLAVVFEAHGRPGAAVATSVVATLVRPEGALLAAVILGFSFFRYPHSRPRMLALLGGYFGFVVLLTAFRLAYFGLPLPNTFYAKVGGVTWWWGSYSLALFVLQILAPTAIPATFSVRTRSFTLGMIWVLATVLYALLVGGDVFKYCRFFLPAVPILSAMTVRALVLAPKATTRGRETLAVSSAVACIVWFLLGVLWGAGALSLCLIAALAVDRRWRSLVGFVAFGAAVLFAAARISISADERPYFSEVAVGNRWTAIAQTNLERRTITRAGQLIAEALNGLPPENKLVAGVGIGALGYYCHARILDLVGLVDPNIATSHHVVHGSISIPGHQRTNAPYVLSRKPDFILIPQPTWNRFLIPAILELWQSAEFRRHYVWNDRAFGYARSPDR